MASKNTAGRMKAILAMMLLFGPAILLIIISTRGCEHKFKRLEDFGKGQNYAFTDANGKKYTQNSFKDNIVVVINIQETCPDSCGVSLWNFDRLVYQDIAKRKKEKGGVKIIAFATDIHGNPIDDLSDLQLMLKSEVVEYDPSVWILAKGNARNVFSIVENVSVEKLAKWLTDKEMKIEKGDKDINLLTKGDEYYGGESFQELMLLFDKKNHLRMVLNGRSEGMVRKMKEHVAILKKEYDQENAKASKK